MHFCRITLALALTAATVPAFAGADKKTVVCISGNMVDAASEGVLTRHDQDPILKRWPAHHAIVVASQSVHSKYAPIFVTTGMLQVVKVVSNGMEYGTKPVWLFQASSDIKDELSRDLVAKHMGRTLADELNKAIKSSATDGK